MIMDRGISVPQMIHFIERVGVSTLISLYYAKNYLNEQKVPFLKKKYVEH